MRYLLLINLLLVPLLALSQKKVYLNGVVGNYAMSDLKDFQEEIKEDFFSDELLVAGVRNFPASLQGEIGIDYLEREIVYGLFINYALTAGKLHYSDFSGETSTALQVSRIMVGGRASRKFHNDFEAYGKLGLNRSQLILHSSTKIHGAGSNNEELGFYSFGLTLEPGVAWEYTFKSLVFTASAGHEFNLQDKTFFDAMDNAYLTNSRGEEIRISWRGFRLGLGVGFLLY